jgi:hypothetical protein
VLLNCLECCHEKTNRGSISLELKYRGNLEKLSVKVKSLGACLSNEEISRLKSLNLSKKTVILSGIDWHFTKARDSLTRLGESLRLKSD